MVMPLKTSAEKIEADAFVCRLRAAKTPQRVDELFAEVKAKGPDLRGRLIDAAQSYIVDEWETAAPTTRTGLEIARKSYASMIAIKDTPAGQFMIANLLLQAGPIEEAHALAGIMRHVHDAKGDAANSVVKAFVAEAAKLSDAEYNYPLGHLKLMIATQDRQLGGSGPVPNPFRKPQP